MLHCKVVHLTRSPSLRVVGEHDTPAARSSYVWRKGEGTLGVQQRSQWAEHYLGKALSDARIWARVDGLTNQNKPTSL